jgi:hypothetical protein
MKFNVVEVKKIGRDMIFSLAVRLEKSDDPGTGYAQGGPRTASPYTIQAVLPYSPEFANIRIGDTYEFKNAPELVAGHLK